MLSRPPWAKRISGPVALILSLTTFIDGAGGQEGGRRIIPTDWHVENPVPGQIDSPLLRPGPMVATGNSVFLFDYGDAQIKAFDLRTGSLLWAVGGPGRGPGEFLNPTDLRLSEDGHLWILDPPNVRISSFDQAGTLLGSIRVEHDLFRLAAISHDRIGAIRSNPSAGLMMELDWEGGRIREVPSPEWTSQVPSMAAGVWVATDPEDGSVAVVFPYSGRLLTRLGADGRLSEVTGIVESRPEPQELTYSPRENMVVHRLPPSAKMMVSSVAISPKETWLLVSDETGGENRTVDRYDRYTGDYLGSWRLPVSLNRITAVGGDIVGMQTDLFPSLFVLTPGGQS